MLFQTPYQVSASPFVVPAGATIERVFSVTGISVAETVISVTAATPQSGLSISGYRIIGANGVGVLFTNATGQPITVTSPGYTITTAYSTAEPPPPTVLLCHCDGTAGSTTFTDVSPSAHTLTATGATVNAISKFGSGSADFFSGGINAVINTGNATDFRFGAGQFTIETWVYLVQRTGADIELLSQVDFGSLNSWDFYWQSGNLTFSYSVNGTNFTNIAGSYTPPTSTWVHLAVDRDASNVLRLYANGAVLSSTTVAATFFSSTLPCLVGNDGSGDHVTGYLDEIRVVNGRAMYGGTFSPPTGPFTA